MSNTISRKKKSEKFLSENNIPIVPELPEIIEESLVNLRSTQDIARRAIIMITAPFNEKKQVYSWWKNENLDNYIPKQYLDDIYRENSNWNIIIRDFNLIKARILLWVLKKINTLDLPTQKLNQTQINEMRKLVPSIGEPTQFFIENSKSRMKSEILDEADKFARILYSIEYSNPNLSKNIEIQKIIHRSTIINYDQIFCWLIFSNHEDDKSNEDLLYYVRKFEDRRIPVLPIIKEPIKLINDKEIQFKFIDSSRPLRPKDFDEVEKAIGHYIPKDLRDFYEKYNGGEIEGERYQFHNENDPNLKISAGIRYFFPMRESKEDWLITLEQAYHFYVHEKKVIPPHFIPIGEDWNGNCLCYNVKDHQIYNYDHESFQNPEISYVAPSLIVFINGMITFEEDESRAKRNIHTI
jgi:hypothetical protein